jgi:hypothetical protein
MAVGSEYQHLAKTTHPSIKKYAEKIGADFECISEQKLAQTTPHWDKFRISSLLEEYDRILYIDTDLIIREDCPNLFEIVPEDCLGAFNEGRFTERSKELLIGTCQQYGVQLEAWDGRYFNSGVMVIGKQHKELFTKPDLENCSFYEQTYLNMRIAQLGIKMFELDYKFNSMVCMGKFTGEERHASYIIHYAGMLYYLPDMDALVDLVHSDLMKWRLAKGDYSKFTTRHLYVAVTGGLGDQICAEPALRFMRKELYPEEDMVVATHFPRIFLHLEKLGVKVIRHGQFQPQPDTPYWLGESLPGPQSLNWAICSHLMCNSIDYTSMALLKRTMTNENREIHFEVTEEDREAIYELMGTEDIKDYIVVHPGAHWESKTFPKEYWQKIVDLLIERGEKLVIVGRDRLGDPPDYKPGARGTVNIDCRGQIDLRNKDGVGSLAALLEQAKALLSNDSAPIHLAGAFDNWIYLLPSCKHPGHVLPYRKGSINYKTKALYKKLTIDEVESRPTQVHETSAEFIVSNWNDYLLEPDKVVQKISIKE